MTKIRYFPCVSYLVTYLALVEAPGDELSVRCDRLRTIRIRPCGESAAA